MNTIPGFAHSVFVLILVGSASALLVSAASMLITARESITAHLEREQAVIDAYTCITAALRTATDSDGLLINDSPFPISLPFSIYHPEQKLCSVTSVTSTMSSITFLVIIAPETRPRVLEARLSIQNSRIAGPPTIHFADE